jgi:hypothetical protein
MLTHAGQVASAIWLTSDGTSEGISAITFTRISLAREWIERVELTFTCILNTKVLVVGAIRSTRFDSHGVVRSVAVNQETRVDIRNAADVAKGASNWYDGWGAGSGSWCCCC